MPFDPTPYDSRAFANNENALKEVERLFNKLLSEILNKSYNVKQTGKTFAFSTFPELNKKVNKILAGYAESLVNSINTNTLHSWALAYAKNDKLIDFIHKSTGIDKQLLRDRYRYGIRNEEGLKAFQNRKVNGMILSERVWNITESFKDEMETAIDVSLTEGNSAAALSRKVKPLLKDPNRIYRKVRDKYNNLVPSKAAKMFHPGQGVYRSSSKNAMRLARTEINMAYREADFLRWSQMDFVKGIEIKLSNNPNHCPVCEQLKGKYPKDFKFIGWHPQCRCFAIPVLLTSKEYNEYEQALLNGEEYELKNTITDVPPNFHKWVADSKDRIERAKSLPYFIRDNQRYFKAADSNKNAKPVKVEKPKKESERPKEPIYKNVPEQVAIWENKTGVKINNDIFGYLKNEVPLKVKENGGVSHYSPLEKTISLALNDRSKQSKWHAERVVYHEYGHAIDWQNGFRNNEVVTGLMDKYRTTFRKNKNEGYKFLEEKWKGEYKKVFDEDNRDGIEKVASFADTLMALNKSYGFGHSKKYFSRTDLQAAEFIAHAFENKFIGNNLFKEIAPELYSDMIAMIDELLKQVQRP